MTNENEIPQQTVEKQQTLTRLQLREGTGSPERLESFRSALHIFKKSVSPHIAGEMCKKILTTLCFFC